MRRWRKPPSNPRKDRNMGIVVLVLGMFSMDTQEFRETANAQMKDGYKWEYVGKTKPSGVPAITIKPDNGEEYILWKLNK